MFNINFDLDNELSKACQDTIGLIAWVLIVVTLVCGRQAKGATIV